MVVAERRAQAVYLSTPPMILESWILLEISIFFSPKQSQNCLNQHKSIRESQNTAKNLPICVHHLEKVHKLVTELNTRSSVS